MILKSIAEYQQFVRITAQEGLLTNLNAFHRDALAKYIAPYLGATLLAELEAYATSAVVPEWEGIEESVVAGHLGNLLTYAKNAAAKFTLLMGSGQLDVQISGAGYVVTMNQNMAPASPERIRKLNESLEQNGYDNIEAMLQFLEANADNYPSWKNSDAYTLHLSNYVNSATEFSKIVFTNASRLQFIRMREHLNNVEVLTIDPAISEAMATRVRTEMKGTISAPVAAILPAIKKASVNLAYAASLQGGAGHQQYQKLGEAYLMSVVRLMEGNITNYPEFAASTQYVESRTNYQSYENTEDSGIHVFGG